MMKKDSMNRLFDKGRIIVKALSNGGIGAGGTIITGDPLIGGMIGSVASDQIDLWLGKLSEDYENRALSSWESEKIGAVLGFAALEIEDNFNGQKIIRKDNFFNKNEFNRSSYDEIAEGIYNKAQKEYEIKKLRYYGNLLANIAFDSEVSLEEANKLIKIAEILTYRQIQLLALFSAQSLYVKPGFPDSMMDQLAKFADDGMKIAGSDISIPKRRNLPDRSFASQGGISGYSNISIYQDLMDLNKQGLIVQSQGQDIIIDISRINPKLLSTIGLGIQLYNLMKLDGIPENELTELIDKL